MATVKIMSNTACMHMFDKIVDPELVKLKSELIIQRFADGEMSIKPAQSVRGAYIYLLAETSHNLTELILTLDCLTRASAYKVTLILGYSGYSRQDKRGTSRGSLGARAVAKVISCFNIVERVVSFDLHSDQIQMAWDIPVDNIAGHNIFIRQVKKLCTDNTVFCSPDAGGKERVKAYETALGYPMVYMDKFRAKANEVTTMRLIGDVSGKDIIIIDDMIDTAGTLKKGVELLKFNGALTITFVATHPVLSGNAIENLCSTPLDAIMVSDTVLCGVEKLLAAKSDKKIKNPKITIVSCIPVLSQVINNIINDNSVTEMVF